MGSGKTELQREILLTWYENPNATNKDIAEACDCSPSYVSDVTNRFDDYTEFEAMMDRQDHELERMFGESIFTPAASSGPGTGRTKPLSQPTSSGNLAKEWEQIPNNPVGIVFKLTVLAILLFAFFQVMQTLLPIPVWLPL